MENKSIVINLKTVWGVKTFVASGKYDYDKFYEYMGDLKKSDSWAYMSIFNHKPAYEKFIEEMKFLDIKQAESVTFENPYD